MSTAKRERSAFGSALRDMRLAAALTIEGLAEASGVSVRAIGDLERGLRTAPQGRTVVALAEGLGLTRPDRERLLGAARSGRSEGYSPVGVQVPPSAMNDFVGRDRELAGLAELGEQVAGSARSAVVAMSGAPGVGKTALALQSARHLARYFPDGQLVVRLRGLDRDAPEPTEIMQAVLRALRVSDRDLLKAGPEGCPELYWQVLAERRLLLVLDDARDEAQVRPLLPGSGGGMVVVTSRRMLTGLESVRRLPLGELDAREAAAMLITMIGAERAAADPGALERIVRYCGFLPLALRAAGDRLTRPGLSLSRFADRLAPEERRLGALTAGDGGVAAAFGLSYRRLTPTAARLFRHLALVSGRDIDPVCAAHLAGQHPFEAENTLEELVEAGLLGVEGDRYRLSDLLRLYAGSLLTAEERSKDADGAGTAPRDRLRRTAVVDGR
ncbi:helix-turn-helix domain-containing protein [Streptomyces sp. NPDC008125]|uniref:helix-turn-helix domain-containing protein n=1 Tax=Streptomyces sp. NPDC008125 TaxID=3364811 RepID=UPI0036EE7B5F